MGVLLTALAFLTDVVPQLRLRSCEQQLNQEFKKSSWPRRQIGDKVPPAARDSSDVARALNQRCYPHTGDGGHSWGLSSYCCQ